MKWYNIVQLTNMVLIYNKDPFCLVAVYYDPGTVDPVYAMAHVSPRKESYLPSYYCNVCGKSYTAAYHMKRHLESHVNMQTNGMHNCDICGKSYVQKCDLARHMMRTHTGERPYKCEQCDKAYVTLNHLKRHCAFSHSVILWRKFYFSCISQGGLQRI